MLIKGSCGHARIRQTLLAPQWTRRPRRSDCGNLDIASLAMTHIARLAGLLALAFLASARQHKEVVLGPLLMGNKEVCAELRHRNAIALYCDG